MLANLLLNLHKKIMPGRQKLPRTNLMASDIFKLEGLEQRVLLSASLDDGALMIEGTDVSDSIVVDVDPADENMVRVNINDEVTTYLAENIQHIRINAGEGDDTITIDLPQSLEGIRSRVFGGEGNDQITTGGGRDAIFGGAGDDQINAGGGNDFVRGGDGNDQIDGGDGNDRLMGGNGDDVINGSDGDDRLSGGDGDDIIDGGVGADRIRDSRGDNTIAENDGDDTIIDGDGDNNLRGRRRSGHSRSRRGTADRPEMPNRPEMPSQPGMQNPLEMKIQRKMRRPGMIRHNMVDLVDLTGQL